MPIARGFAAKAGMTSQASQDFWEKFRDLEQKHTAMKQGLAPMTPQEKQQYDRLNKTATQIRSLTKTENAIEKGKYSEQQKKTAKEKLQKQRNELARRAMAK